MLVTKTSTLTGKTNTLEIPITQSEFERVQKRMLTGEYIQGIVPNLSAPLRHFLISGITPEEWDSMFNYNDAA